MIVGGGIGNIIKYIVASFGLCVRGTFVLGFVVVVVFFVF